MRKALASLITVLALPSLAAAGEVEITGFAGYTFPFYSQTYTYDPGPVTVDVPGISIRQSGSFELKASGGPVFGGAVGLFPVDPVGFELRFDSADLTIKTQSPTYNVTATLPPPLAPVTANLTLKAGQANLSSARPFSLNLKLRTSGDTRVFLSGGLSYLPDMGFSMDQTVALGVSAVNLVTSNLEIATITLRARRKPGDPTSNWGANAGLGFRVPLGDHGGLVLEGRGFYFPKQTFEWEPVVDPNTPLSPVQQKLLDGVLQQIDPKTVEFKPWWVQVTIGVCYRF
jgi:hypothetical protein